MPIYEYRCHECGSVSEFLVNRMGDTPADLRCSQCQGEKMSKVLSTMAVHQPAAASPCQSGHCPIPAGQRGCLGGSCNLQ